MSSPPSASGLVMRRIVYPAAGWMVDALTVEAPIITAGPMFVVNVPELAVVPVPEAPAPDTKVLSPLYSITRTSG